MLKNFVLTAWRNLKRHKTYAAINVAGLGLAIGCCLTTFVILRYELSFDSFHRKADRTYRVVRHMNSWGTGVTPYPAGAALRTEFPDLAVTQVHGPAEYKISVPLPGGGIVPFKENRILFADPAFLQTFDFAWEGTPQPGALKAPFGVLLTRKAARKYFAGQDPVGKTLLLADTLPLTVAGVLADPPTNTSTPFSMLVSYATLDRLHPGMPQDWNYTWKGVTYLTLPEEAHPGGYQPRLKQFEEKYLQAKPAELPVYHLQPLRQVHTDDWYWGGSHYTLPGEMMWAFLLLGGIVLVTACFNFVNLSTAQATRRAREVGLRKAIGGTRRQLVGQFLLETGLLVAVATLLGLTLSQFLLVQWNQLLTLIDYDLSLDTSVLPFVVVLGVLITLAAGGYPAWIMSGYRPVEALKNQLLTGKTTGSYRLRKTLVVLQFTFTNLLIIGTLVAAAQLHFLKNSDLGFRKASVLQVEVPQGRETKLAGFRAALLGVPGVRSVSFNSAPPMARFNSTTLARFADQPAKDGYSTNRKAVDEWYLDQFGLRLVAGHNVRPRPATDTTLQLVINEVMVRQAGFRHPAEALGRVLHFDEVRQGTVVGVVGDFHHQSFREGMQPLMLVYEPGAFRYASLTLAGPDPAATISGLEARFKAFFPDSLFVPEWLDDHIALIYVVENLMYRLFSAIAVIAVAIGMLGLYGLVSFMAVRRSKEIGIRKVLGASVPHVLRLFLSEYALLLGIAFVVAAPLIHYGMGLWLRGFQYKIALGPAFYVAGFGLSCLTALLTVGHRTWRAATANPVNSLKSE